MFRIIIIKAIKFYITDYLLLASWMYVSTKLFTEKYIVVFNKKNWQSSLILFIFVSFQPQEIKRANHDSKHIWPNRPVKPNQNNNSNRRWLVGIKYYTLVYYNTRIVFYIYVCRFWYSPWLEHFGHHALSFVLSPRSRTVCTFHLSDGAYMCIYTYVFRLRHWFASFYLSSAPCPLPPTSVHSHLQCIYLSFYLWPKTCQRCEDEKKKYLCISKNHQIHERDYDKLSWVTFPFMEMLGLSMGGFYTF